METLVCLSVNGFLGCFQFRAIKNEYAVDICIQSLCGHVCFKTLLLFFKVVIPFDISINSMRIQLLHILAVSVCEDCHTSTMDGVV